jgi:DNA-binding MarR family transcriptional regulator
MSSRRDDLVRTLMETMRDTAGRGVVLHQAVAERFGLGPTDLKCLDLARAETDLTAGRLAEVTGMSTSAITAVLDRLETGGFIERRRDPVDRRKVRIASTGRHEASLNEVFGELDARMSTMLADYDDEQLQFLAAFLRRLNTAAREFTTVLTEPE